MPNLKKGKKKKKHTIPHLLCCCVGDSNSALHGLLLCTEKYVPFLITCVTFVFIFSETRVEKETYPEP
jgi:hypothetical protein